MHRYIGRNWCRLRDRNALDEMTFSPKSQTRDLRSRNWQAAIRQITVALLLFTVLGLFTLAKTGQYYPESNPAQHLSVSIKMNIAHSSIEAAEEPQDVAICFFLPQPPPRQHRAQMEEPPPIVPVGVTVSMQHRSPPLALA